MKREIKRLYKITVSREELFNMIMENMLVTEYDYEMMNDVVLVDLKFDTDGDLILRLETD
jgi:hypothetical protein